VHNGTVSTGCLVLSMPDMQELLSLQMMLAEQCHFDIVHAIFKIVARH